ncbi:MAG: DUF6272 family protein [Synechococcales cyanobacterium]
MQVFGDYQDQLTSGSEYLVLCFSPSARPLKERWRNNGLSADFMADYMATFFPGDSRGVQSAVSFVANELLENAMKYYDYASHVPITITLFLLSDRLVFRTTNAVSQAQVPGYQKVIQTLLNHDPEELYFQQLEHNFSQPALQSGMGFLTMMHDYQAQLGWRFLPLLQQPQQVEVSTMVQLPSGSL